MALCGSIKLVAGRVTPAVPLSEVRTFLREPDAAEDSLILSLIGAATDTVERLTHRSLIYQTFQYQLDAFPAGPIELPRSPCTTMPVGGSYSYALPRIRYYTGAGTLTTMTVDTDYLLDLDNNPPRIHFPVGACLWPIAQLLRPKAVLVDFLAGYGADHTAVPDMLKSAIKILVAAMFENRESVDVPEAVTRICRLYSDGAC